MPHLNPLGQPIGPSLREWTPPLPPERATRVGRYCRLEPLDPAAHAQSLFDGNCLEPDDRSWTYLPYGPFASFRDYQDWVKTSAESVDPLFFAVCPFPSGQPLGVVAYLRITPAQGSIEIGHIHFSPKLKRTLAATEALFLLIDQAFAQGYRRCEWKCDALNAASRAAAERLGFVFEGVFRQAAIYKGRSRDTAWYSVIDGEWPSRRRAFEQWLAPSNFDRHGAQLSRLSDRMRETDVSPESAPSD